MRLQVDVLNAGRGIGHLMHGIGGGETVRHAADLAMDVDVDVARLSTPPLSCSIGASGSIAATGSNTAGSIS